MAEVNGKPVNLLKLALSKSVIANGEETMFLEFREPTGGDIATNGNPVSVDFSQDPPKINYDAKAMTAMLAALATVPPSTIKSMTAKDWETAALMVTGFFLPEPSRMSSLIATDSPSTTQ
jgi:hypothetical protein